MHHFWMPHQELSLGRFRTPQRPNSTQSRLATSSYHTRLVYGSGWPILFQQIYNTDMQLLKQAVGIDISKQTLSVCFGTIDHQQQVRFTEELSLKNSAEGFARLLELSQQHQIEGIDTWFIVEATGVYYQNLAHFLAEAQQKLCVMLPNYVKQFARSTSVKTKTDRVDARLLCRMALERQLDLWQPASPLMRQLKALTRERAAITEQLKGITNRLAALDASYAPSQQQCTRLEQHRKLYQKHRKQIEAEITALLSSDPDLHDRIKGVMQISGVGLVTIATLLAETDGFAMVGSLKQLVSYAGLDIVESQSGQHQGRSRISKKGNCRLRTALYMPALAAIRCDESMRAFYQRICQRRPESKKPGIIAVARKLLRLIYAIWKTGEAYDPQRI